MLCVLCGAASGKPSCIIFCSADLMAPVSLPFSSFLSLISGFCSVFPRVLSNHLKLLSTFLGFLFISLHGAGL